MPEVTPEFTQTRGQRHLSVHPPASERNASLRDPAQGVKATVRMCGHTYVLPGDRRYTRRQTIHAATEARTRGRNLI